MNNVIYLDYAATTPCDERVVAEMLPHFTNVFGNPNSQHVFGNAAKDALDAARLKVSRLINSDLDEVIFTSGATESTRIALTRTAKSLSKIGKKRFLTLPTEHKATLTVADALKADGFIVELLDVENDGMLNLQKLEASLSDDVGLISVCFVNNETGVIQNIEKIVEICHNHGCLIHVDATQALGKIEIDVKALNVDFMSASGHKIYAPKGIGLLFCKKSCVKYLRVPKANPEVEFGIRAGTVPVSLCVGFGKAAEIASAEMHANFERISRLRDIFVKGITSQLEEIYVNGAEASCYPGIINMSFRGCEGEALMMEAPRIAVSSGSACTSNSLSISHVLEAMHVPADIAQSSLRITIGQYTTEADIAIAIEELVAATKKLRQMSPVWDMVKSGIDIDSVFRK
ncbi:MAG: aminotransferase class V-fold PLP-dependent enzyme [Alphaproteobacteria bacterium]|nr:aminotransferase class V-fold PLP-dependent enzyme [Alphaproteobacteria bacterium]